MVGHYSCSVIILAKMDGISNPIYSEKKIIMKYVHQLPWLSGLSSFPNILIKLLFLDYIIWDESNSGIF